MYKKLQKHFQVSFSRFKNKEIKVTRNGNSRKYYRRFWLLLWNADGNYEIFGFLTERLGLRFAHGHFGHLGKDGDVNHPPQLARYLAKSC